MPGKVFAVGAGILFIFGQLMKSFPGGLKPLIICAPPMVKPSHFLAEAFCPVCVARTANGRCSSNTSMEK